VEHDGDTVRNKKCTSPDIQNDKDRQIHQQVHTGMSGKKAYNISFTSKKSGQELTNWLPAVSRLVTNTVSFAPSDTGAIGSSSSALEITVTCDEG